MPAKMRLDTFEVSWERRTAEYTTNTERLAIPFNSSAQSNVVDLSTSTDVTQYRFQVTVPNISKTTNGTGTVTANLDAKPNAGSAWTTVQTQTTTGTTSDDAPGFQFTHINSNATYDNWRLQIVTTGGTLSIVNMTAFMDVLYTGNQRRKVKNLVGTVETTAASTVTNEFDDFIDQTTIANPNFYVSNNIPDADMKVITFTGTYNVDRISADRGEGRSALVMLSLTQEGAWVDE
jgi:hypothetical protein